MQQRLVGAGVEPGVAPAQELHLEPVALQVDVVEVRDLELAARGRRQARRDVTHLVVVEVKPGHGEFRLGLRGFFLDADHVFRRVELHHAVAVRIAHLVAEDDAAFGKARAALQHRGQPLAVEDVVAKDQADGIVADELPAEQKGLGEALGPGLHLVGKGHAEACAVAEHLLETGQVRGRGDDEDLADAGQHQHRKRVVDHGLVVDGQELLAHHPRDGIQPRARPAGQDDAFHAFSSLDIPPASDVSLARF
ncbi:hypothetical protein DSECCO2_502370 [anaerobic digester metagenome]